MKTLWRYVRLYGYFLSFSFSKAFEFRFDFYMRIIMDLCYYAVAISFFRTVFLHTTIVGGWNESQMMVFVSGYLIVDAINMTVFANNLWFLPTIINNGELDYYLVRPVSSLFFLSLREFAANSFLNLICALGVLAWALHGYTPFPGFGKVILFLLMLLNGSIIFFCMNMMANTLVFWTHSSDGFGDLVWMMAKLAERPDGIFHGAIRFVITFILPFAIISSFPARIIIEQFNWGILLHMFAMSGAFLALLVGLWSLALKNYSSASS